MKLLDRGGEVHASDKSGKTPPCMSRPTCGRVAVCTLLLDRGATHLRDEEGRTPLFKAVKRNRRLLLHASASFRVV
jgi:hypothetical protein